MRAGLQTQKVIPYFYPRSPCGERQTFIILPKQLYNFYPRSPCGERRTKKLRIPVPAYFYPRSPCGERLYDTYAKVLRVNISIHALLAESDLGNVAVGLPISNFYPRSPCGERRFSSGAKADTVSFLSTLSLRRATPRPPKKHQWPDISIHALLAESDSIIVLIIRHVHAFLSTLSLRRATSLMLYDPLNFYPRSPYGERRRR